MFVYETVSQLAADLGSRMSASVLQAVFGALGLAQGLAAGLYTDQETDQTGLSTHAAKFLTPAGVVSRPASDLIQYADHGGYTVLTNAQGGTQAAVALGSGTSYIEKGSFHLVGAGPDFTVYDQSDADSTLQAGGGTSLIEDTGNGQNLLLGSLRADAGQAQGSAILIAQGHGTDTLIGGAGADDLYGGQHTRLQGGAGAGQQLYALVGGTDTLVAGTGGLQSLVAASGANLFDDRASVFGTDTLVAGAGSDTIYTGAAGATLTLGRQGGAATVLGGTGADTIAVAQNAAYDSIDGGGGHDVVTFQGHGLSDIDQGRTNIDQSGVLHLTFTSGQHADIAHVATVLVGGETIAHG